jgi:hypothetical protein
MSKPSGPRASPPIAFYCIDSQEFCDGLHGRILSSNRLGAHVQLIRLLQLLRRPLSLPPHQPVYDRQRRISNPRNLPAVDVGILGTPQTMPDYRICAERARRANRPWCTWANVSCFFMEALRGPRGARTCWLHATMLRLLIGAPTSASTTALRPGNLPLQLQIRLAGLQPYSLGSRWGPRRGKPAPVTSFGECSQPGTELHRFVE